MWELLKSIKDWLISLDWGTLQAPTSKNIALGVVDMSRYESNLIVSILPEEEEEAEENEEFIDGEYVKQSVLVTVFCRGKDQDKNTENICKYSDFISDKVRSDCELGGICAGSGLGIRKFFLDAGAVGEQLTAVEIPLTILYRKS